MSDDLNDRRTVIDLQARWDGGVALTNARALQPFSSGATGSASAVPRTRAPFLWEFPAIAR
jgi:hypothetical protein